MTKMADEEPSPGASRSSSLRRIILDWYAANPVGGLIGTIASVIAIPITFVLFFASIKSRELSVYVNPTRTILVRNGHSSDLHVVYKGQPVSTDVTAFQVGLWNAGRESIHTEHILEPIVIETVPKVPILEAVIRFSTRPVVNPALDVNRLSEGRLGISWKILEHNDGVVMQLLVAGPASETVKSLGVVEGQQSIIYGDGENTVSVGGWILLGLGMVPTLLMATFATFTKRADQVFPWMQTLVVRRTVVLLAVASLLTFFFVTFHNSPTSVLKYDRTMLDDRVSDSPPGPP